MKRLMMAGLMVLISGEAADGQGHYWGMTYGMSTATAATGDFIGSPSWRGWGLEVRKMLSDGQYSIGGSFGWTVFDDEAFGTINADAGDFTGLHRRFINSVPFLATLHYYPRGRNQFRPYLGLGTGVYYNESRFEIGAFAVEADAWQFGLAPEAGLAFPIGPYDDAFLYLNAKYNYGFETDDLDDQSYWGFNIGFAFQTGY